MAKKKNMAELRKKELVKMTAPDKKAWTVYPEDVEHYISLGWKLVDKSK